MCDFRDLYTIKIDKVEDLFKYLASAPNELTFWRGQANSKWFITSSFFRWYDKDSDLLIKSLEELEKQDEFNKDYLKKSVEMVEDLQKVLKEKRLNFSFRQALYLGQHYGLPTNLIDFTLNPYIALYFAFDYKHEPESGYASIFKTLPFNFYNIMMYGIKKTYFVNEMDLFEEFICLKKEDTSFKIPKIEFEDIALNGRIQNQQGVFIYFPHNYPYDFNMYRIRESGYTIEKKIDINCKLKTIVQDILNYLGIYKPFIYPKSNFSFEKELKLIIKNIKEKYETTNSKL